MPKTLTSVADIASRISQEMKKHPQCAGVEPPDVFWKMMDSNCNWTAQIWKGDAVSAEACEACIEKAVQSIPDKYNVFDPG